VPVKANYSTMIDGCIFSDNISSGSAWGEYARGCDRTGRPPREAALGPFTQIFKEAFSENHVLFFSKCLADTF